jgi:predicted Fe-Mo cluster-binding NifX family protein
MKVCFPVQEDEGLESKVYGHFGSAPVFIVVDTETNNVLPVGNKDLQHEHGACNPVAAIDGREVDAVVVGGIGGGAIRGLNAAGIRVYGAGALTVKENLSLFQDHRLSELSMQHACQAHQGGCGS